MIRIHNSKKDCDHKIGGKCLSDREMRDAITAQVEHDSNKRVPMRLPVEPEENEQVTTGLPVEHSAPMVLPEENDDARTSIRNTLADAAEKRMVSGPSNTSPQLRQRVYKT